MPFVWVSHIPVAASMLIQDIKLYAVNPKRNHEEGMMPVRIKVGRASSALHHSQSDTKISYKLLGFDRIGMHGIGCFQLAGNH